MDTATSSCSSAEITRPSKRSKWSVSKARKVNQKKDSIDDFNCYEEGEGNEVKKSHCQECQKRRRRQQVGKVAEMNLGSMLGAYFHRVLNGSTWKRLGKVMLLFEKRLDRLERKIRDLDRAEKALAKEIAIKEEEAKQPVSVCHVLVDSTPTTKDIGTSVDGLIIVTTSNESENGLQSKSTKFPCQKRKYNIQRCAYKKNVIKPIEFDRLGIAYRLGILKCPVEVPKVNAEDIQELSTNKKDQEILLFTPVEKKENVVIVEN